MSLTIPCLKGLGISHLLAFSQRISSRIRSHLCLLHSNLLSSLDGSLSTVVDDQNRQFDRYGSRNSGAGSTPHQLFRSITHMCNCRCDSTESRSRLHSSSPYQSLLDTAKAIWRHCSFHLIREAPLHKHLNLSGARICQDRWKGRIRAGGKSQLRPLT